MNYCTNRLQKWRKKQFQQLDGLCCNICESKVEYFKFYLHSVLCKQKADITVDNCKNEQCFKQIVEKIQRDIQTLKHNKERIMQEEDLDILHRVLILTRSVQQISITNLDSFKELTETYIAFENILFRIRKDWRF